MDTPPTIPWADAPELREAFDHRPCLIRKAWPGGTRTWSIQALDHWMSQGGLGWPELRLFKDGSELPAERYTVDTGAARRATDVDAVLAEYAAGATLQTIGVDVFHAPVRALCDRVAEALAPHVHRIHANAYLTPAEARGFDHHWDTHDVIVLQLEGRKHWQVHGAPLPSAAPSQVCGLHKPLIDEALRSPPLIDTVLEPGDLLYLPRGQVHAARTAGACSLHLTLGLHVHTRLGRLEARWQQALAHLARQDPALVVHALGSPLSGTTADRMAERALRQAAEWLAREEGDAVPQPVAEEVLP
jgi:lysine-specific demethylase/histidyl-hydroxylase NO66